MKIITSLALPIALVAVATGAAASGSFVVELTTPDVSIIEEPAGGSPALVVDVSEIELPLDVEVASAYLRFDCSSISVPIDLREIELIAYRCDASNEATSEVSSQEFHFISGVTETVVLDVTGIVRDWSPGTTVRRFGVAWLAPREGDVTVTPTFSEVPRVELELRLR